MRSDYKQVWLCDERKRTQAFEKSNSLRNKLIIYATLAVITLLVLYLGGVFTSLSESGFESFTYPLEIENFQEFIEDLDISLLAKNVSYINSTILGLMLTKSGGINSQRTVYLRQFDGLSFTVDTTNNGSSGLDLDLKDVQDDMEIKITIVVKSAVNYYAKRDAIRDSWRVNKKIGIFRFRTVFMVGACDEMNPIPKSLSDTLSGSTWTPEMCRERIRKESIKNGDMVQSSGIDSYYNNTIKSVMTHRWLTERFQSDFAVTIDDDYAFEIDNFIDYLKAYAVELTGDFFGVGSSQPAVTPASLIGDTGSSEVNTAQSIVKLYLSLKRLSQQYLYAGYVRSWVHPHRHHISKYYISKKDYPFSKYPPFVTGGMILMSRKFSRHLYLSSYFLRSFKFDDVYMGIIAYKLHAEALHREECMCQEDKYLASEPWRHNSTTCIGVHDVTPLNLLDIWTRKRQQFHPPIAMSKK